MGQNVNQTFAKIIVPGWGLKYSHQMQLMPEMRTLVLMVLMWKFVRVLIISHLSVSSTASLLWMVPPQHTPLYTP